MLDSAAAAAVEAEAAAEAAVEAAARAAAVAAVVTATAAAVAADAPAAAALLMTGTTPVAPTTGAIDERLPVTLVAPGVAVERAPAKAMLLAPTVVEGKPPIGGTNRVGVGKEAGGKIEGEIVIPNFDCILPIRVSLGNAPEMYEIK